jgi:hypothetical protein
MYKQLKMGGYNLFKDGEMIKYAFNHYTYLWYGHFSIAHSNGSIVQFVTNYLKQINKPTIFLLHSCDGNISKDEIIEETKEHYDCLNQTLIVSTLAQREEESGINYLYFPLDDGFFENGISHYFDINTQPLWEERSAIAYWRGACSGNDGKESIRCKVVGELINYEFANAKLVKNGWENGKGIPENHFSNAVHHSEFSKYKIFMIIDGNCIASNHMWGFASGCVPFLISNAKCWFTPYLVPFVNYIPIQYDLSDLREKIEWVINNDSEARKIAEGALLFSRTIFSSEFQKQYLKDRIDEIVGYIG